MKILNNFYLKASTYERRFGIRFKIKKFFFSFLIKVTWESRSKKIIAGWARIYKTLHSNGIKIWKFGKCMGQALKAVGMFLPNSP